MTLLELLTDQPHDPSTAELIAAALRRAAEHRNTETPITEDNDR